MLYQIYKHEPKASDCISDTTRPLILYSTYDTSRCIISCSTEILKKRLNLAEQIRVKVYANQDDVLYQIYNLLHGRDFYCVFFMNYS